MLNKAAADLIIVQRLAQLYPQGHFGSTKLVQSTEICDFIEMHTLHDFLEFFVTHHYRWLFVPVHIIYFQTC